MDHLTFERGGGGWKNWFEQEFFLSHWPVFFFTAKALQEIFFSNLPPPPPPQKSNGPPLKFNPLSNNGSDWLKEEGDRLQFMYRKLKLE